MTLQRPQPATEEPAHGRKGPPRLQQASSTGKAAVTQALDKDCGWAGPPAPSPAGNRGTGYPADPEGAVSSTGARAPAPPPPLALQERPGRGKEQAQQRHDGPGPKQAGPRPAARARRRQQAGLSCVGQRPLRWRCVLHKAQGGTCGCPGKQPGWVRSAAGGGQGGEGLERGSHSCLPQGYRPSPTALC